MRIALVTTSWPASEDDPSGHFVRAEARALERAGHRVEVVAPRPGGAFGWPGVAARVRENPLRVLDATRWTAWAMTEIRRFGADRVIAHWAVPCAWPVALGAGAAGLEVVSHGGDVRLLAAMPRPVRTLVAASVAGRAARWRFVSARLRDALLARLEAPERGRVEAIAVVQAPALELPDVAAAVAERRRELGGARVAVSVGRLVATKRVDRAIEHVAERADLDALVVVGDGPERPRLEAHARRHRVDARFLGALPRRDALAWIGAAHVLIHASEAEGLSTVLREAEHLGTPVVQV